MIKEDAKNRAVHFDLWRLKNCGPCADTTQGVSIQSVSLRRLVGVARDSLGVEPDWKQSVQSAKGRPWAYY